MKRHNESVLSSTGLSRGNAQGTAVLLCVFTLTSQTGELELLRLNPVVCLIRVQEVGALWQADDQEQLKRWCLNCLQCLINTSGVQPCVGNDAFCVFYLS